MEELEKLAILADIGVAKNNICPNRNFSSLPREEVYKLIDGERDYQNAISTNMNHQGFPTVEAEILMMEQYLMNARTLWVNTHGNSGPALDMMRKVAGISVRCFENHGCPARNQ